MTLEKWQQEVSPHLQFIEAGAEMAARHARALPCRAEWATKAQDELATARKVLETALAKIIAAEIVYEMKPTEQQMSVEHA